jgi:hypothetical protein
LPDVTSGIFFILGLDTISDNRKLICPGFAKATPGAAVVSNLSQFVPSRHCDER